MTSVSPKALLLVIPIAGVFALLSPREARADPVFVPNITCGAIERDQAYVNELLLQGVADPMRNYFTPGLAGGRASFCTGVDDRSFINRYAIVHDTNVLTSGAAGYLDIVSPSSLLTHREIGAAITSLVSGIASAVSAAWSAVTGFFQGLFSQASTYDLSLPPLVFDSNYLDQAFSEHNFGAYYGGGEDRRPPSNDPPLPKPNDIDEDP